MLLFAKLRDDYEPQDEPFRVDTAGIARKQRETYLQKLEEFLEKQAKGSGDALEPHVRFLMAKTAKDILVNMRDITDFAQRKPFHDKAIEQLMILRDRFPDWQGNWSNLAPMGKASTVRGFLEECEKARAHEEQTLPRERAPNPDPVVLVRTDRGDMRFGLYSEDAPDAVAAFLKKAREGRYDGTAFYEKTDTGADETGGQRTIRGGDPATRDAKPYDRSGHQAFGKLGLEEQMLPGDSRNRIPHTAGILSAWHGTTSEYDETSEVLLIAKRSPELDYRFTPIGKTLDDASNATLDRIWASLAWKDDKAVAANEDDVKGVDDFLQVPVRIVKVLVYEKGTLATGDVTPAPQKAMVEDSEKSLSTVKPDQFKVEPPAKPAAAPPTPPKPTDEKPAGEKPAGDR